MRHDKHDEDVWVDHFEIPDGFSKGESNRTVLTWITDKPLAPGNYMLDACMVLTDQDPGETCHSWVMLRFNVPEDTPPILGSFAAVASVFLGLLAWAGASMRGSQLPLPACGSVLLLALACSGGIGAARYRLGELPRGQRGPELHPPVARPRLRCEVLSGLLGESDVAVLGLFTPDRQTPRGRWTTSTLLQKVLAMDGGPSASFVQIATGEDVKAYNLDDFSLELNGSWPPAP